MAVKFNPLTGQMEETGPMVDPNQPPEMAPPPMEMAGPGGAAPPAAPAAPPPGVSINMGSKVDSVTTTTPIKTKDLKAAAKAADTADADARQAAVKKAVADQELESKAIEADKQRQQQEQQAYEEEINARRHAEEQRMAARAAADSVEAEADAKVQQAADKAINWDDRKVPFKILGALLRAGSVADAIRTGQDPNNTPTVRALDSALAQEKDKKRQLYLRSKERYDALKSRNVERIKREYDDAMKMIEIEANSQAKALLMSEKTAAFAQRQAKNDPNGQSWQANRDVMLAKIDQDQAARKLDLEEKFIPKVTSVDVKEDPNAAVAMKPAPQASTEDVEKVTKLEQAAQERMELAEAIAKDPKAFERIKSQERRQKREESYEKVPYLGKIATGIGRPIDSLLGIGGPTVADKLAGDAEGSEINRRLSKIATATAKDYGGAITEADIDAARAELGVQGQDAAKMAETLRRQAIEIRRKAEEMRRQRSFR